MKKLIIAAALMSVSSFVNATSFDCTKALTSVEKLICTDAFVSQLDSDLSKVYKSLESKPVEDQKAWIKNVRNKQTDIEGLAYVYTSRIEELSKLPTAQKNAIVKNENSTTNKFRKNIQLMKQNSYFEIDKNTFVSTKSYETLGNVKYDLCMMNMYEKEMEKQYWEQARKGGFLDEFEDNRTIIKITTVNILMNHYRNQKGTAEDAIAFEMMCEIYNRM